jgi:hypothetical protein
MGVLAALALIAVGIFPLHASAAVGTPRWAAVAATGPTVMPPEQSEVQRLWVDAAGGTFTLTFSGQTTSALPFDASAGDVEAALTALSTVGGAGASVQVSGGPGDVDAHSPYDVAFGGSLANDDVPTLETNATQLTGSGQSAAISTAVPGGPGTTLLALYAQNIGGLESTGSLIYSVTLPPGILLNGVPTGIQGDEHWDCVPEAGQTKFTCTLNKNVGEPKVQPGETPPSIKAPLVADPGAQSGTIGFKVEGGGAPIGGEGLNEGQLELRIGATPAPPGIQSFIAGAYDEEGLRHTAAGGHPYTASTGIFLNTKRSGRGELIPSGEAKDIIVDLPPGFLGNPIAVPQCPESTEELRCPLSTMVGIAKPVVGGIAQNGASGGFGSSGFKSEVYNTEAPYGFPGKFRFNVGAKVPLNVVGSLRSDSDYGLTAASLNTPQLATLYGTFFTFWGAPADSSHDASRCHENTDLRGPETPGPIECEPGSPNPIAFLTNATNCAEQAANPPVTLIRATLWQNPNEVISGSAAIPPVTGCDQLKFDASFAFTPSDSKSDSPASFRTSLTVPSEGLTNPTKLTTPEIKDTVVQLPAGVVLNPAGADGLEACSMQQIGYRGGDFPMPNPMRFSKDPNTCPEASKVGTGELKTALIEAPLHGALYLAAQGDGNPFGSLFAIYLVIEDPRHGIYVKLPGRVDPDPQTGQMTVTFRNLPQLPFTRLDLNLKGGNRSALASPTTCGRFVTTATNTPWSAPESGPPTVSAGSFEIDAGPNGMPCAPTPGERPLDIGWTAGAENVKAGQDGPFAFQIARPDGSQELESLELTTPKGVSASLKGVPQCSGAQIAQAESHTGRQEQASPSCPADSQVGTLQTSAGSGPTPFYVGGKLYLAGPYKGAPLSVVAITPAVAGPFDLGNVVVRSAAHIDRFTAQVRAVTDAIPQFLKGVGLRVRDVRIKLDRKDWTINPTSCDASSVDLVARGNSGAVSRRSVRFQVGGCQDLGFGPKFTARLAGGTKRSKFPAFTAEIQFAAGQANTKGVQVVLPHSQFLEQAHIGTICTRPQAAARACPPASIYGFAEATSPLIDGKLMGPVFLKSSNHKLPDLAIALRGPDSQPVEVEISGRIDSIKGQIRNTIENLPDVPVSTFTLRMKGGKKGLLVNSRDLCRGKPPRLTVNMLGQNNKTSRTRPVLRTSCRKQARKKSGKHARGGGKKQPAKRLFRAW